jgi:glutamate-1-semialdehyde 2,1-aminomutase
MIEDGIRNNLNNLGKKFILNRVGSMMTLFFTEDEVTDLNSAMKSDTQFYSKYFHLMLSKGIYLPCSQFEAMFVSYSHTEEEIRHFVKSNFEALSEILK